MLSRNNSRGLLSPRPRPVQDTFLVFDASMALTHGIFSGVVDRLQFMYENFVQRILGSLLSPKVKSTTKELFFFSAIIIFIAERNHQRK